MIHDLLIFVAVLGSCIALIFGGCPVQPVHKSHKHHTARARYSNTMLREPTDPSPSPTAAAIPSPVPAPSSFNEVINKLNCEPKNRIRRALDSFRVRPDSSP